MAVIPWRVDRDLKLRLDKLVLELQEVEPFTEEWYVISDDIRSLPGCPHGTCEEEDTIEVICVDTPRVGYTGSVREN